MIRGLSCLWFFGLGFCAQDSVFYFPHFTEKVNEWQTVISLVNPVGHSMEVQLEAFDTNGNIAGITSVVLEAASAERATVSQWFPDLNTDRGWIRVTSDDPQLQGMLVFTHLTIGGTSSLPLFPVARSSWTCAELKSSELQQSGFVVTNVVDDSQSVAVVYHQDDGQLFSTQIELGPRAKWVGLLSDLFTVSDSTGYLTLQGQNDVVPLALTFVNGLKQIVAVPAVSWDNDGLSELQHELDQVYARYRRAGAHLGVRPQGHRSVTVATGLADIDAQIPLTTRFPVEVGSITKSFTAAAMLLLQEQGSLDLDQPLSTYRPDFPKSQQITLRMLLNHTSGIPDYDTVDAFLQGVINSLLTGQPKTYTPEDLIEFALMDPFQFEPGTNWGYANTNYILAGVILEEVSGQPLEVLFREMIFEPLGLHHTFLGDKETPVWMCQQYIRDEPSIALINTTQATNLSWAWAAGALLSTPEDLIKWADALFESDFLQPGSRAQLLTQDAFGYRYGLGVVQFNLRGRWVWGHDGATFGGVAFFGAFQDSDERLAAVLTYRESESPLNDVLIAGLDWMDQQSGAKSEGLVQIPQFDDAFFRRLQIARKAMR